MFFDRGNHYEFLSTSQELASPGELHHAQTYSFSFKNVEKQYESYNGINVRLRYFIRATVSRRMSDVMREKDLWVYSYRIPPEINSSIKMDVGIEDCLHIEFEYSKSKYHLKVNIPTPSENRSLSDAFLTRKKSQTLTITAGRDCRTNIFPPGASQNQAHGAQHHPSRDHRSTA